MNHRWTPNIWLKIDRASSICPTHSHRSAALLLLFSTSSCRIHVQQPVGYFSLRHFHHLKIRGRKGWTFKTSQVRQRLGLHTSSLCLNTSGSRWSVVLSQTMLQVRSTLDTVSQVVSGTHTELLSKISRLKPEGVKAQDQSQTSVESTKAEDKEISPNPAPTVSTTSNFSAHADFPTSGAAFDAKTTTSTPPAGSAQVTVTPTIVTMHAVNNSELRRVAPTVKVSSTKKQEELSAPLSNSRKKTTTSKESPGLFHPGAFSANLDETYSYLSHHINSYFGSKAKPQNKKGEDANNKPPPAAEEKAKKLLLQREKIIARKSVDNRTRALVQALHRASDIRIYISRVEDLSYHLLEFPETRGVAVKEKVIPCLLCLEQANDQSLRAAVREALTLVGYHKPVKGRGIRILSIDGGGLRGVLALQTLQKLEALTGKPIYKLFDYICGVSTGAIIGFMLGIVQIPVKECDDLYRRLGSDIFRQNVILGTVKMGWSHAFYDSEAWENILKDKVGSDLLVETSRNPECPKVAAVSTIVNQGLPLKAHVFRNYNLLPDVRSHYMGGCQYQLWQAIRATSAAPGYFQEFKLGNDLHQDGGLLINNPTALAIHESKCLWPHTPLECVVSLGTGRAETATKTSVMYTSLKTKLTNVISSATDTEEVHAMLDAFLPPDTYFRFNPFVNKDVSLDESRLEKLDMLQADGLRYLERNEEKLKKVVRILTREKSPIKRVTEWARLRLDMYSGLSSKP
ncbi:calcium-independent phospholipase A2-gamma-like [Anableps anableps]